MHPLHNKKGEIELSTLASIILILIALGLIIGIFTYAASRAEEETSIKLCRGFNALRFGTRIDYGPVTINAVPRACKTIDSGDLPGKKYKDYPGGVREGAKAELREMIAKCWYMWLEGYQPNMFETSTIAQNKCFICYVFSFDKEAGDISRDDFIASLDYPYSAVDSSDRCNAGGQGGKCMPPCDKSSNLPRKTYSNKCPQGLKCCIAEDLKDECINKGGSCEPKEGYKIYDKWQCKTGKCYIKNENFGTYLDYVQGTKGIGGGAGFLVYQDQLEKNNGFKSGKKYAISLISPGNKAGLDTFVWGAATLLTIPATVIGTINAPFLFANPTTFIVATGATYYAYKSLEKSGSLAGYNFIYISEYNNVEQKCQVETGIGERK